MDTAHAVLTGLVYTELQIKFSKTHEVWCHNNVTSIQEVSVIHIVVSRGARDFHLLSRIVSRDRT